MLQMYTFPTDYSGDWAELIISITLFLKQKMNASLIFYSSNVMCWPMQELKILYSSNFSEHEEGTAMATVEWFKL